MAAANAGAKFGYGYNGGGGSGEASGSGSKPEGKAAVSAAQDDATFDFIMGRKANNADRCARGVATAILTKQKGKDEDYLACVAHFKELWHDYKGTIYETTGINEGQRTFGCGKTCGSVLGFLLGPHVTAWIHDGLVATGFADCLNDGPGYAQMTLDIYSRMLKANDAGGLMVDPEAPGFFYTLAAKTAEHWRNTGLKLCKDGDWWQAAQAQLDADVAANAEASASRAHDNIEKRASSILSDAGINPNTFTFDEQTNATIAAAFTKAAVENEWLTKNAIDQINFNISRFSPGTLTDPSPQTADADRQKTPEYKEFADQYANVLKETDKLVETAKVEPMLILFPPSKVEPMLILFPPSKGGGGGVAVVALAAAVVGGFLLWRSKKQ